MKNGAALLVSMLSVFSIYSAAQSSFGQLTLLEDATLQMPGASSESSTFSTADLSVIDRSAKRQRTAGTLGSSRVTVAQVSSELREVVHTIGLLRTALEKSEVYRQQTDARLHEMSQEIFRLRDQTAFNIDAIKQLSSHTVLFMATAACDPQSMQEVAILHIKKLCELKVPADDEAIQVICLATAKRFCDELSKCSYEERSSFAICASAWLNKIKSDKLPARLHPDYQELLQKIRRSMVIPLPSLSFELGLI